MRHDDLVPSYQEIVDREQKYVLPVYSRYPLALARGEGVHVFDVEGRRYLDFVGGLGVNALGHSHPRIVKRIREAADGLIHTSNLYYHPYYGRLAEKLAQLSGLDRVFLTNSGTEAIEGALKLARAAGHAAGGNAKCGLVSLEGSYHGRTFGALSVTGQIKHRKEFEPMLGGNVSFAKLNDVASLAAVVDDDTCAIVLEPIQGEGGVRECSAEFLRAAREIADKHNALLVLDEIQCGLGRTGTYFAFQQTGIVPDVVCIAKPIAGGLPMGAFIVREKFSSVIPPGKHGTTFGGGPFTCQIALEFFSIVEEEGLLENVREVGAYMKKCLTQVAADVPVATEVRGRGCMQSLELNIQARPVVDAALKRGLLLNSTQEVVLRLLPSFLIKKEHVDEMAETLRAVLTA
jgi:predicted acetylornithine/succinylornithine family transaminase